jgi:membrane-bound lytic murein transglycosylase B
VVEDRFGKKRTTQAEELTARSATKSRTYLFLNKGYIEMKINHIKKLSIVFCISFLFANEKEEVLKAVISHAGSSGEITAEYVVEVFNDQRLQEEEVIIKRFQKKPEKTKTYLEYKKIFINETRIAGGARFYSENKSLLAKITREFEIDPLIVVAIIGVETNYGQKTKEFSVINSLYTQAKNMPKRSKWATKEIAEFLVFCSQNNIDPFSVEGSYAGAFGYGQFIPSSFNRLSVDYNKDGQKNPYEWEDVLGSIAYYLVENGYPKNDFNFSHKSKAWRGVRTYNRSDKYANVIIDLRNEISRRIFLLN